MAALQTPLLLPPSTTPGGDEADSGLNSSGKVQRLSIDDVLKNYCGEFGRYQAKHFVLTSLAWALEAFHTMVMIFADREPDWRCSDGPGSGCSVGDGVCSLEPGSWEWVGGPASSTVSEFGLICGDKYKVGLVQAMFFAGCMIGAGIFGHLSDSKLGRKGSLTIVCIMSAVGGFLTALSPNYWVYLLLRLLTGLSTGGIGLCAFVLATEPIGPSKRGIAGMSTFYFFSGGIATLSGIAYIFRSWRALYIASSVPSVLFLFVLIPCVSESPRWCLIKGKMNQATQIMHDIAKSNRKHLPENVILALDEDADSNPNRSERKDQAKAESEEAVEGSLMDVLRVPLTRIRLLLAVGANFTTAIVYYGISLNVVNLGTNLYLNVFFNAIAEWPAFLLTALLLDRLGRRPLGIASQWLSGIFCIAGFFVQGEGIGKTFRMVCGIIGIFGMAGTYNLLFIYTMELFPTVVRNAALGCASQAAQLGAILAPFIVVLGDNIPFGVFGACAVAGGLLTIFLPETMNRPLYDTMSGIESGERTVTAVV